MIDKPESQGLMIILDDDDISRDTFKGYAEYFNLEPHVAKTVEEVSDLVTSIVVPALEDGTPVYALCDMQGQYEGVHTYEAGPVAVTMLLESGVHPQNVAFISGFFSDSDDRAIDQYQLNHIRQFPKPNVMGPALTYFGIDRPS